MRRILSQIVILVLFLFLTAFAAVWFEDTGGDEEREVERAHSLLWIAQAGKKTWQIIDGIANISSGSYQREAPFEDATSDDNDDGSIKSMASDALALAENFENSYSNDIVDVSDSDSGFRNFLANIFKKAPERYLDTKVYSNGWRNFVSLYWLEYKELLPE